MMAIDITNEKLMGPHEYVKLWPSRVKGKSTHINTFYRHIQDGLECVKSGRSVFTSLEAVQRYVEAKTEERNRQSVRPSRSRVNRDNELAKQELKALRVLR
jgi:hypothetical protein